MVNEVIKKRYKQTEIGIIPQDWEIDKLDNSLELLTDFEANGSFASVAENVTIFNNQNYAWYVRATDLEQNSSLMDVKWVNQSSYKFLKKTSLFGEELLITKRGEIGKVYLFHKKTQFATLAPNLYLLKLNQKSVPKFLFYYFKEGHGNYLLKINNASSTLGALYKNDVKAILIPFPPKEEQSLIASVLSDTDMLIASLDKLIIKKKNIKQGAIQELLTGKRRLSGFKGEWKNNFLKNMVQTQITDGPHMTPQFISRGVPFLSVNNLVNNKIDLTDLRFISKEDDIIFSKKCKPQRNDILLGKAASVGMTAIVNFDLDFNIWSPLALIRLKKEYSPKYVHYFFQTRFILNQIKLLTNSSSQGNIGMGDLGKLEFKIPNSFEEQSNIAEILSDMDVEIQELERKKDKYQKIKIGMIQELLTGRIRLI